MLLRVSLMAALAVSSVVAGPVLQLLERTTTGPSPIGCYADGALSRVLRIQPTISASMTVEICLAQCTQMGYSFAGVEDGNQCFCGSDSPPASLLEPSTDCSMTCAGAANETCGAGGRISIYETCVTGDVPPPPPVPFGWAPVGCFVDITAQRVLPAQATVPVSSLSVETCTAACKSAGFSFAGLEFATECWCGNSLTGATTAFFDECNSPCPGSMIETCGASNRLNVYSAVAGSSTPQPTTTAKPTTTAQPTTTSTTAIPLPTDKSTFRACTGINFQGCQTFNYVTNQCVPLTGAVVNNVHSFNSARGMCTWYSDSQCANPIVGANTVGVAGTNNAGSPGVRSVACFDGEPTIPVPVALLTIDPPVNVFLCQQANFAGSCATMSWQSYECHSLSGTQFFNNLHSFGPDDGSCTMYTDTHCNQPVGSILDIENPGLTNTGVAGAHLQSFMCI